MENFKTTDAIRKMKVGDELSFPAKRTEYIRTLTGSRLIPERRSGMRWTTAVDMKKGTITVKRIT